MPSDLTLMFKAMITMEGLGRQYDPDFHVARPPDAAAAPAIAERYRPAGLHAPRPHRARAVRGTW